MQALSGRPAVDPAEEAAQAADDGLAEALKSLSHPKRLRLLRFLAEPRSLEEVANELQVARQSANEHVDRLLATGLVERVAGRGPHGPVTHHRLVLPRLFDVYDRLGVRLGIVAAGMEEDVHAYAPTAPLASPGTSGAAADSPRLVVVHGMRVGRTVPLSGSGPWLIGRDPHAALPLEYDGYASNRHAEIRRAAGGFEVADGMSSNGTFVDGVRLPRSGSARIANGALLRVGKTLVLFRTT
jgi:DNA-binding transcriptional ArsR family regulator